MMRGRQAYEGTCRGEWPNLVERERGLVEVDR